MIRSERILVIGDEDRQVQAALALALPLAQVVVVGSWFDGIAELSAHEFTAVLAPAEAVERRPEPAVRTLRELAPGSRVVLFGHPTLEPLSRKMMEMGADDYFVTPASPRDLQQALSRPVMREAPRHEEAPPAQAEAAPAEGGQSLEMARLVLDALADHPQDAVEAAVRQINERLGPEIEVAYAADDAAPAADGRPVVSQPVSAGGEALGQIHLRLSEGQDAQSAKRLAKDLADILGRVRLLQERSARLQRLAITDELTGIYNGRYFRHFLAKIIETARVRRFPVTLLIFDIDNFKKYNDQYGHGMGDEILRQTAALMKRCCREHDLVARIGGDEFAVVFWEKEGPRQPKAGAGPASRTPPSVLVILDRFRRLLSQQEFPKLGPSGQGTLTISGGLAVYPYDARTPEELIEAADQELVGRAKQAGKNSIFLVGEGEGIPRGGE